MYRKWVGMLGLAVMSFVVQPAGASTTQRSDAAVHSKKVASAAKRSRVIVPARPTQGQLDGLHNTEDPLELKSGVALVLDQDTNEVLFAKNSQAVLPIASITKLMTALVVTEAGLPLDEVLTINAADIDVEKGSRSRLRPGTALTREEMLHLALMASENRAASALGRHSPAVPRPSSKR
jgi:D-alanyl-D-alanine endopeptidase (penicillin-binding protein 7)